MGRKSGNHGPTPCLFQIFWTGEKTESGHSDYSILAFPSTPPKIPDFTQLPNLSFANRPIWPIRHGPSVDGTGPVHSTCNGKNLKIGTPQVSPDLSVCRTSTHQPPKVQFSRFWPQNPNKTASYPRFEPANWKNRATRHPSPAVRPGAFPFLGDVAERCHPNPVKPPHRSQRQAAFHFGHQPNQSHRGKAAKKTLSREWPRLRKTNHPTKRLQTAIAPSVPEPPRLLESPR